MKQIHFKLIAMSDYFTARRARMNRVDAELRALAQELKDRGHTVFISNRRENITYFCVQNGQKQVDYSFNEVPYRWTVGGSHVPNIDTGSGYIIEERDHTQPYTADEIESFMRDYNGKAEDLEKYHRSFLQEL